MFQIFLKRTADVLAPRLCVVFRLLLRLSSFPAYFRLANAAPIPKGQPSSSLANYRPISTTPFLWCSAADSHLHLLDRIVTMEMSMHPLSRALPLSYVLEGVPCGALVVHRCPCMPHSCKTYQYRRTFVPIFQYLYGTILMTMCSMVLYYI